MQNSKAILMFCGYPIMEFWESTHTGKFTDNIPHYSTSLYSTHYDLHIIVSCDFSRNSVEF